MTQHLVFVTQKVDPADPVLGSTWRLIRGLADVFDHVTVIGNEVRHVPSDAPNVSVISLGKEGGSGSLTRGLRYERALLGVRHADALLAHMCPDYLTAAAPILGGARIPALLWFTHPRDSARLRIAERAADVVLTTFRGSYPRQTAKLRAIGHAIDMAGITFVAPKPPGDVLRLIAVGRSSDSKRYDVAIAAIAAARVLGANVSLQIVGPATTPGERAVRIALGEQITRLGLDQYATIVDGVAPSEVLSLISQADAVISTTIDGSADKAVFEGMAVGRPTFVSNPAFSGLLSGLPVELRFATANAQRLAERIVTFANADVDRLALGKELRSRVGAEHSLTHWSSAVRDVVDELGARS